MIILNEKEYAKKVLNEQDLGDKPRIALTILAKYLHYEKSLGSKAIARELMEYMLKWDPARYEQNPVGWEESIEEISKKSIAYPLYEINGVSITQKELDTIHSVEDLKSEMVLFSMLCFAKWSYAKSEKSSGWVNRDLKDIFQLANVRASKIERDLYINKFYLAGLVDVPKKSTKINEKITFMDPDGREALFVDDFRNLGWQYLRRIGEGKFTNCCECGIVIKQAKNGRRKYCPDCLSDSTREKNKLRMRESRK